MNPIIQEIERRQEWDRLWSATRNGATKYEPVLAALKVAVEELQFLRNTYLTGEGQPYGIGKDADATLRAIAQLLGVKETG